MAIIGDKAKLHVSVTQYGVISSTAGIFAFDEPKTIEEHYKDFCDLGGARLINIDKDTLELECGIQSGLVVIQVGVNRGDFVPNLDPGSYGVEHTAPGNLLRRTKRIVNTNDGTTSVIFGIAREHWPDGLNSCVLVQPDTEGHGPINLLADHSTQPIESTPGYRFYTPFYHIPGAGSGFLTPERKPREGVSVYPLYPIGVMTLNRVQLSELLRAFNKDWSNGSVFSCKNAIGKHVADKDENEDDVPKKKAASKRKKKRNDSREGVDNWC